ncbi:MAG TPA: NACHT domain-containing protein [Myxococcaceae bacterium]|nr:NACHT domain-containing protein [Myxococcaceae bacterium]
MHLDVTVMQHSPIWILEPDRHQRGALFTRLVREVFQAWGYDPMHADVAKAGREIDLRGRHRLEPRRFLCAECKATATPVGGADLNKFVGVLDAERSEIAKKDGSEALVTGYFVSLSGFTDSARQQEDGREPSRMVLLDGEQLVEELIKSRILVPRERAVDRAARCISAGLSLAFMSTRLLVHQGMQVWLVCYGAGAQWTHFTLVHADGEPLAPMVAKRIIAAAGDALSGVTFLAPREQGPPRALMDEAKQRYFSYLASACGEIVLDGLPADEHIGSRQFKLDDLFVPLHVTPVPVESDRIESREKRPGAATFVDPDELLLETRRSKRFHDDAGSTGQGAPRPVAELLSGAFPRIALLAAPGGGKSTLLKRIAIAYAIPARRAGIEDALPARDWFPIFLRCRELGSDAREPILTLLANVAERSELPSTHFEAFQQVVLEALHGGTALLLVDGLDEISDDGPRRAFVSSLRTFVATHANTSLVVTSREAGFRSVANTLGAACDRFRLAELSPKDIKSLVQRWYGEVYGDTAKGREQARNLAAAILRNDRIAHLAGNPLLLCTLLLINRWLGQLPTKRSVLYEKAIEVLLSTWNVQAHDPIDLEEALPRLEYIAFTMMTEGRQRLTAPRLRALLKDAKQALPEALGYSRFNDNVFLERVELRSSILIHAGHEEEDGKLVPVYEFRHLTFQEYLAARAIEKGHYPRRQDSDTPASVLATHLYDPAWREVVPLAAVLVGRKARDIIQALMDASSADASDSQEHQRVESALRLLERCLLDEVQLPPEVLEKTIELLIPKRAFRMLDPSVWWMFGALSKGKFADALREVVARGVQRADVRSPGYATVLAATLVTLDSPTEGISFPEERLRELLARRDPIERVAVAQLLFMDAVVRPPDRLAQSIGDVYGMVLELLESPEKAQWHAACRLLAMYGVVGFRDLEQRWQHLVRLAALWCSTTDDDELILLSDTFSRLPFVPRELVPTLELPREGAGRIRSSFPTPPEVDCDDECRAALIIAFYARAVPDSVLAECLGRSFLAEGRNPAPAHEKWAREFLKQLGPAGRKELRARRRKRQRS